MYDECVRECKTIANDAVEVITYGKPREVDERSECNVLMCLCGKMLFGLFGLAMARMQNGFCCYLYVSSQHSRRPNLSVVVCVCVFVCMKSPCLVGRLRKAMCHAWCRWFIRVWTTDDTDVANEIYIHDILIQLLYRISNACGWCCAGVLCFKDPENVFLGRVKCWVKCLYAVKIPPLVPNSDNDEQRQRQRRWRCIAPMAWSVVRRLKGLYSKYVLCSR